MTLQEFVNDHQSFDRRTDILFVCTWIKDFEENETFTIRNQLELDDINEDRETRKADLKVLESRREFREEWDEKKPVLKGFLEIYYLKLHE